LGLTCLVLFRVEGNSEDEFFKDHAWVDAYVPSRSSAGREEADWRLCTGLIHRTLDAAQQYLPPSQKRTRTFDFTPDELELLRQVTIFDEPLWARISAPTGPIVISDHDRETLKKLILGVRHTFLSSIPGPVGKRYEDLGKLRNKLDQTP